LYQACVSDEVFEEICDCEYATKMHTALDKKYNVQSVVRQVQLQMELQKVYIKYEETFADYYRRARGIQRTLKDSGYETEEATFCTIVYQGIRPNDIQDLKTNTENHTDYYLYFSAGRYMASCNFSDGVSPSSSNCQGQRFEL
jgi:hypothetical protein